MRESEIKVLLCKA